MVDYSIFDKFCRTPTWDTGHGHDEARFLDALAEVVDDPDFHAADMREYIDAHRASTVWPKSAEKIEEALLHLTSQAEIIQTFLRRTGR